MSVHNFEFEWDPAKASSNLIKHGVDFVEAETVFQDPFARVIDDPDHSADECREIIIGYSNVRHLLFVAFAARGARIRIISVRRATREERKIYEEKCNQDSK